MVTSWLSIAERFKISYFQKSQELLENKIALKMGCRIEERTLVKQVFSQMFAARSVLAWKNLILDLALVYKSTSASIVKTSFKHNQSIENLTLNWI